MGAAAITTQATTTRQTTTATPQDPATLTTTTAAPQTLATPTAAPPPKPEPPSAAGTVTKTTMAPGAPSSLNLKATTTSSPPTLTGRRPRPPRCRTRLGSLALTAPTSAGITITTTASLILEITSRSKNRCLENWFPWERPRTTAAVPPRLETKLQRRLRTLTF